MLNYFLEKYFYSKMKTLFFLGVKNAKFVCGPAEEVISSTVKSIKTKNVIAVVDPPRAGLRKILFLRLILFPFLCYLNL